jgi:hypothetical protein
MKIKIEQNMDMSKFSKQFIETYKPDLFDKNEPLMSEYARPLTNHYDPYMKENTAMYLKYEETYFNDCCRFRGHAFLNEVYDRLSMPRTKDGQVMGWFYDEHKDNKDPIEFTLYIDSFDMVVDFNVEGNIYDIFDEIAK